MHLATLRLNNFKNIAQANLDLGARLNCFVGDNGMGKSNLLDAIHYMSHCRSMTGATDAMMVMRGSDWASLECNYSRCGTPEDLLVSLMPSRGRKVFKRGGKEIPRLSQHLGRMPSVLVSPSDMDLVTGPSMARRRLLDSMIGQSDSRYLDALIKYTAALDNRNALLRQGSDNHSLFETYEMAMDRHAAYIRRARAAAVDTLAAIHATRYRAIAGDDSPETPSLTLTDDAAGTDLALTLDRNRDRDRLLKYTTTGPHRDDLNFALDGMPLRRTASQGQAKTFTIALRMAQYDFMARATGTRPLLLLDDIFDKLDEHRVTNIVSAVTAPDFGQIYITDTNLAHLDRILDHAAASGWTLFNVDHGTITPSRP